LDWQGYGCARAVANDVPAERIINTWPLPRLLAWTESAQRDAEPGWPSG